MTNAVAPFDHDSFVDSLLLEAWIARTRQEEMNQCLAAAGFGPDQIGGPLRRDDPALVNNLVFPDIERLAREGFVRAVSSAPPPGDSPQPDPEKLSAVRSCSDALEAEGSESERLFGLFVSVRGAWEQVLAEIETDDEVRSLAGEFSSCLRSEGIPPDAAGAEAAFLGYADRLMLEADGDGERATVDEWTGKLYARCGRGLFETRERLRSGERRAAFLREHEAAVRELSSALFGSDPAE